MDDPSASSILLRIVLSVAAVAAGWWLLGPVGLVVASPLVAIALARPILAVAAGTFRGAKALALRSVEGTYYAFRGVPVAIYEDELEQRWIAVEAIRKVLPSFPRDAVLQRVFPSGLMPSKQGIAAAVRVDELIAMLSKASQADTVKLKNWLQREVYFPSGSAKRAGATPTSLAADTQNRLESSLRP